MNLQPESPQPTVLTENSNQIEIPYGRAKKTKKAMGSRQREVSAGVGEIAAEKDTMKVYEDASCCRGG